RTPRPTQAPIPTRAPIPTPPLRPNPRVVRSGRRRAEEQVRRFGEELLGARLDAGLSQRRVAVEAGVTTAYLGRIEAGQAHPALDVCGRLAAALGGELSLRFYPGTGPHLRDHLQAAMLQALRHQTHRRWRRRLEVAVFRPVRGVIDLVLDDASVIVATEIQSDLRRFEQQLRWAKAKADALWGSMVQEADALGWTAIEAEPDRGRSTIGPEPDRGRSTIGPEPLDALATIGPEPATGRWTAEDGPLGGRPRMVGGGRPVSRLLVLRSTARTRRIVGLHQDLFRAAYPASIRDPMAALTRADRPWPGPALLWMRVEEGGAILLDRPPREIRVGR
ncbi:MAG: XRE family transcriptional regulator, partial [Chloroflexota bacterium]